MYKFAHIADTHLGANRQPALEKLEIEAFNEAMNVCMMEKVDFILICGDLFHIGLPDLSVVNNCARKLREVHDRGILIYVVFGSHDYNPNTDSIVDVLDSAGLIKNVSIGEVVEDGKIRLKFVVDDKTGAKITGVNARKGGVEKIYYENLDIVSLEKEKGFKIFCLHTGLSEFKPAHMVDMDTIPVSLLPKNFDYYAGGHIHQKIEERLPGYEKIVYPGPIFSGYTRDLEQTAKGEKRGFFIVSFDDKVRKLEFHELKPCNSVYYEFNVDGMNSTQANRKLEEEVENLDVEGKLVLMKIKGELSGGKTSEVNATQLKNTILENGAIYVEINRYGLTTKEFGAVKVSGEDIPTIEKKLLRENIGAVAVSIDALKGDKGVEMAEKLLSTLRIEMKPEENKQDYLSRTLEEALNILDIKEARQ
jgi:hypothetical protein